MLTPLGIRNNNPGNIRWSPYITWRGQIGKDQHGFVVFATPEDGIRALARNLKSYYAKGLTTVRKIVTEWAPPSQNNTAAYIQDVANRMGVSPDQVLTFPAQLQPLVEAIIWHENGQQPYLASELHSGVMAA